MMYHASWQNLQVFLNAQRPPPPPPPFLTHLPVHAIKLSYLVILTSFSETLRSKMSEEDFNINNISTTVPVIVFAKSQQVEDINEVEKIQQTFPSVIMRGLGLGHLLCGLLAISFQVPSD